MLDLGDQSFPKFGGKCWYEKLKTKIKMKNRFSFKEARILKGRLQKKRKKTNFDHRQFLRTAHRVSRFRKPRDRAEAILRVLG